MLDIRRFTIIIALGFIIATPISSNASDIHIWDGHYDVKLSAKQLRIWGWCIGFYVDPINTKEFQLDVAFDTTRASYIGIEYVSPYIQTAPPDLSRLGDGLLQDVAGYSSISPPPPGNVDVFMVIFQDLQPSQPIPQFTVFASSNDFVIGYDTDTGGQTIFGPSNIIPATCIPVPSAVLLLGSGLAGLAGFNMRKRKKL